MSWLGGVAGAPLGMAGLWAIGGGAAVLIGLAGAQTWRLHSEEAAHARDQAAWATREKDIAQRALVAEQRERTKEQAWAKRQQEISDDATRRLAAADAAASAAVDSARGLRERVAALAAAGRRVCGNPAAAGGRAPASDPIGLLAELLGRIDERAGVVAAYADRARIAGDACVSAYESLRGPGKTAPAAIEP